MKTLCSALAIALALCLCASQAAFAKEFYAFTPHNDKFGQNHDGYVLSLLGKDFVFTSYGTLIEQDDGLATLSGKVQSLTDSQSGFTVLFKFFGKSSTTRRFAKS
jgi:hypothetical protein